MTLRTPFNRKANVEKELLLEIHSAQCCGSLHCLERQQVELSTLWNYIHAAIPL